MDTGDVLDQAAKMVERPGFWTQNQMCFIEEDEVVSVCAMGALMLVTMGQAYMLDRHDADGDDPYDNDWNLYVQALDVLSDVVRKRVDSPTTMSIARWNDRRDRRAEEVAEAMRDAAREWRIAQGGC